jgi:hypothetical protein
MSATNISVAATATLIINIARSSNTARTGLLIYNNSAQTVFLGDAATVTTSNGYPLFAGDTIRWSHDGGKSQYFFRGDVYGIVASSTADVRVWEFLETR